MSDPRETVSINPASGDLLGRSAIDDVEQLGRLVGRARAAQPAWAATRVRDRARAMLRVRSYLVEHADALAETISRDNGKTRFVISEAT